MVEKPAALTLGDLAAMQAASDAAGVVLLVGQTLRFGDLGRALHATVTAGDIGAPVFVQLIVNSARSWPSVT